MRTQPAALCCTRAPQVVLYGIWPAVVAGGAAMWLRLRYVRRLSRFLRGAFEHRKAAAIAASSAADTAARVAGGSVVSLMADLRGVYRFRDVRQVSLLARDMRVWDEDGVPDPTAAEYGEFVLKVRPWSPLGCLHAPVRARVCTRA